MRAAFFRTPVMPAAKDNNVGVAVVQPGQNICRHELFWIETTVKTRSDLDIEFF